jgi:type I restriction enzyme S subunit
MLMMDMVKDNGVCVGVLKEGVFFNSIYKDLRKCLIEKYNVTEVISVPKDQFENTSTKTSIIIFKNTKEKTKKIKFSELLVERYENDVFEEQGDKILLVENKGDIKNVIDKQISVSSLDDLKEKKYSLNGKDYNDVLCYCPKGFELNKLGNMIEYKKKSNKKASEGKDNGKYRFYTSSEKIKLCDFVDFKNDLCLIVGTGGNGSLFLDNNFSCSSDNFVCTTKNNDLTKYIYNYLKCEWTESKKKLFNGSTIGHLNKENLNNYQIPIPKDMSKMEPLITKLHDTHIELTKLQDEIPEKEKEVQNRIQEICDTEDCDEYKFGDVCEVETGKYIKKEDFVTGEYPIYGGGDVSKYINLFNRENCLVINKDALGEKCVRYVDCKFFLNHHGWTLKYDKKFVNIQKYINYWLMNNTMKLFELSTGSVQKGINQDKFYSIEIKIPKSKTTMKNLEKYFEKIDELKLKLKNTEQQYEKFQNEFKQYFEEPEDDKNKINAGTNKEESDSDTLSDSNTDSNNDSDDESEQDDHIIESKGVKYYIENDIAYECNKDDTKGKKYGKYINGKIIKYAVVKVKK